MVASSTCSRSAPPRRNPIRIRRRCRSTDSSPRRPRVPLRPGRERLPWSGRSPESPRDRAVESIAMSMLTEGAAATWGITALAAGGVIIRPWRLPEAVWAMLGAAALVVFGLLPWPDALAGVGKGVDVYLFLTGMMVIAELARQEGLFDWFAALAVKHACGSPERLFVLVYAVGTAVTVLLSNDATAVVLTPAVYAATRAAGATPLPYLFACAFVANAASFVLPISNPANLVVFGAYMPPLAA